MAIFKNFIFNSHIQISILISLLLLFFADEVYPKTISRRYLRPTSAEYREFYEYIENMKEEKPEWQKYYTFNHKKIKKPKVIPKPKEYNYVPDFLKPRSIS